MNLHTLYATKNECYIKNAGTKWTPKGVMIHSTGANNPNLKRYVGPDDGLLGENVNKNYWNVYRPGGKQICCHAFVGKLKDGSIASYQILPWTCKGWNNGGSANSTHIAIEICEDGLTDRSYFEKVYKEAVELTAYLCKQYGLSVTNVIDHSEGYKKGIASNHGDVAHWFPKFGKSMDSFRKEVEAQLKTDEPAADPKEESNVIYRVQIGAYKNKKSAEALKSQAISKGFQAVVTPYVKGDVNGDGKVTAEDAREALKLATGKEN